MFVSDNNSAGTRAERGTTPITSMGFSFWPLGLSQPLISFILFLKGRITTTGFFLNTMCILCCVSPAVRVCQPMRWMLFLPIPPEGPSKGAARERSWSSGSYSSSQTTLLLRLEYPHVESFQLLSVRVAVRDPFSSAKSQIHPLSPRLSPC